MGYVTSYNFATSFKEPDDKINFFMKFKSSSSKFVNHFGSEFKIITSSLYLSINFNKIKVKFDIIKVLWLLILIKLYLNILFILK